MANQEHLDILKQGVEVWNQWRREHPNIRWPDLDLRGADLEGANLEGADLVRAQLREANLRKANLKEAKLLFADLVGAILVEADLQGANFVGADMRNAQFQGTYLQGAVLCEINLRGADLSGATLWATLFGNIDLSDVIGLDSVIHRGPSTIGTDTIYLSKGNIPEVFLKGAGVDDTFITYVRSLVGKAVEYYSCFISYSSKDDAFAKRLYADLQSNNVRCWFAPEDLKIGDKFWHRIDESIRRYDKLLVVLSEHSVQSDWVEREVMAALEKEKQGKIVLFPITLDDAVKDCTAPWAADLRRQRHIGDFRGWKNHDKYQKAFERLLRDLKASS